MLAAGGVLAALLLACGVLVRRVPALEAGFTGLAARLGPRMFPVHSPFEVHKYALLRVGFGLVLVLRGYWVWSLLLDAERGTAVGIWTMAELVAGALLALGLLTQWALAFLVAGMWQFGDVVVAKSTLGNDVAAVLAVLLMLVEAGKFVSLDARLLRAAPRLRAALLYGPGATAPATLFVARLVALSSYWAVCVYSVVIHLNEPAWLDGSAGPLLLSSNFMSGWHAGLGELFAASELAVATARGLLWLMILWYPVVLPLVVLGGAGRAYVIAWGWAFFALSLQVLQLGSLAQVEMLLWLALFWSRAGIDERRALEVFYDDRCNLCDRTVRTLVALDLFGRLRLRPVSLHAERLAALGLDRERALADLHGRRAPDGRVFGGYELYVELCRLLVLLWPLWPVLLLGRWLRVGPALYRWVADRRARLFGVCATPSRVLQRERPPPAAISRAAMAVALALATLLPFYFLATPAPGLGWGGVRSVVADAAHYLGVAPINVFNRTDLRMAENWFTLGSVEFGEVPLLGADGSRLGMHVSDRIYFGHTLRFRRAIIDSEGCMFDRWREMVEYLSRVYLEQRRAEGRTHAFTYRQFHQPLPSTDLIVRNRFVPAPVELRCERNYAVTH